MCVPPAPTAVGEEETTVNVSSVVSPSLLLLWSSLPPSLPFVLMLLLLHCHGHQDHYSVSLAIILLAYAMHSPPTVTNWCWRPTITLLSLAVVEDLFYHSDCLAPAACAALQTSNSWDFKGFPPPLEYQLIQGPACSYLEEWRLGVTETLSADRPTIPADIMLNRFWLGASVMGKRLY